MKIAKLSLVAAVAVAGFTTANAQPLEEAIKNVDVSGSVVYRYNDYDNDNTTGVDSDNDASNNYKVGLNLASKVNDDVKFNSRFIVGSTTDASFAGLDTAGSDTQASVTLSNAYFGYTGIKNTTVNVGKQGLTTPWTVALDSDGGEQTGTGVLALSTLGNVTLAAAYFNQTNLNGIEPKLGNAAQTNVRTLLEGNESIATVGAIANLSPVTVDAWFLTLQDTFNSYTVGGKTSTDIAGIKLGADARYASLTLENKVESAVHNLLSSTAQQAEDNSMAKLVLTADAGLIDGKLAYAMTGKDGGLTALDNDATTTLLGWNLTANGKADADYVQAVLGFDILSNLNLSANYGNLQYIENANSTTDVEEEEVYAQLLYKMSKNLTSYVRYGTYTKETTELNKAPKENNDDTRGRLQVEYTF